MFEQERLSWGVCAVYVLHDPARPRFCSTATAVWGVLYSARKFGKFGLSFAVPTHLLSLLTVHHWKILWLSLNPLAVSGEYVAATGHPVLSAWKL